MPVTGKATIRAAARTTVERLTSQLLCDPRARHPTDVVDRLLAVQAQDPRGARLAIRARSTGLRAADVDEALTVERSLIISWLNRGTLHLVAAQDYWWLQSILTPQIATGNARRLAEEGVSPSAAERGVAVIVKALESDGPLTRGALRERVRAVGVPVQGQALVHLLVLATLRGHLVRGPMVGSEQAYVLVTDWLGRPPAALDRDSALGQLAHRYLAGHGPATDRDLARWAGVSLTDARSGLRSIGTGLRVREDGLLALAGGEGGGAARVRWPPPRLLGAFDPLLLGWTSREPILGTHTAVVTINGIFRPFALVAGKGVATWRLAGGRVVLDPFAELDPAQTAQLETDAADVARFLA